MQQVAAAKVQANQRLKEAKAALSIAKAAELTAFRAVQIAQAESDFLLSCKKAFAALHTWNGVYILKHGGGDSRTAHTEASLLAALELEWYTQEQYGRARGVTRNEYADQARRTRVTTAHTYFAAP